MTAKKLSKRDIKEDTFITNMLRAWEYLREHQGYFFAALIAIVVIVAGTNWYINSREQSRAAASTQFSEAISAYRMGDFKTAEEIFKVVNDRYGGVREGVFARYFLGSCALLDGRNTQAIEHFDAYLKSSGKLRFFHDAAMDGKAIALENERRYREAGDVYAELADNLVTNDFMEKVYLRRAADCYKQAGEADRAITIMERLLELTTGTDRLDVEVELTLLRG